MILSNQSKVEGDSSLATMLSSLACYDNDV